MVSIKEEIISDTPFQSSGQLLVILSVSRKVDFGDTREVSIIGNELMCSKDRHTFSLKTEMNVY